MQIGTPCLIHQPRYNIFQPDIERELLGVLEEHGIGCIAFCPLAQGLLTNKYLNGIPQDSRAGKPNTFLKSQTITDDYIRKAKSLNEIAAARGQDLAQMSLAWVLRDSRVTSALIGASKVSQIEDSVKALDNISFTEDELKKIAAIATA